MSALRQRPLLERLAGLLLEAASALLLDPRVTDHDDDDDALRQPVSVDEQLLVALRPTQRPEFF